MAAVDAKIIRLHTEPDPDTVKTLWQLLTEAQNGTVVGFAYVAIHRNRGYSGDIVGEAKKTPAFTNCIVQKLQVAVGQAAPPSPTEEPAKITELVVVE